MDVTKKDEQVDGNTPPVRCIVDVALAEMPRKILLLVC
jgi:hypothetical protein